ncbi:cytochrome C [uncultured Paraglaciecola sp.]|uniref:cytochrome C n=1 Tax=uncultured Paraglaciecola sp. TaxID=1765024 RepID=UPI0030D9288B|tara:strand:+ start:57913 stop:58374 length:462 start_codon:yes stop_codon:yes gene_type:complete
MNPKAILFLPFILTFSLFGCDSGADSPRGFSLPQGDAVNGEKVFTSYKCLACHKLEGFIYDSSNKEMEPPIQLGGTATRVKTYADLVTSIINPSHNIARSYSLNVTEPDGTSKMLVFNDVMTVTELVDLVTFLQGQYEVQPHEYTHYGQYHFN